MLSAAAALTGAPSVAASDTRSASSAPSGYHTVVVKKAGFSIAIPDSWHVATNDAAFRTTQYLQVAFTNVKRATLILVLLLPTDSLPSTSALRAELAPRLDNVHITRTKVGGASALQAVGSQKKRAANGVVHTVFETIDLVSGSKGLLDFNFGGKTNGRHDKTVQTMIKSVALLH